MNEKIIIDKRGLPEEKSNRLFEATVDKARDIHRRAKDGNAESGEAYILVVDRDGIVDASVCGKNDIEILNVAVQFICNHINKSKQPNFIKKCIYEAAIDLLKMNMPKEAEDDDSDELINALFNGLFGGEK